MATAKQCSAPRHAGIHLQERLASRRFKTDFSGHFPVLRGERVSVGGISVKRGTANAAESSNPLAILETNGNQFDDGTLTPSCKGVSRQILLTLGASQLR